MYIGIDIGGTKCAVIQADDCGRKLSRVSFPTDDYNTTIERIMHEAEKLQKDLRSLFLVSSLKFLFRRQSAERLLQEKLLRQ